MDGQDEAGLAADGRKFLLDGVGFVSAARAGGKVVPLACAGDPGVGWDVQVDDDDGQGAVIRCSAVTAPG